MEQEGGNEIRSSARLREREERQRVVRPPLRHIPLLLHPRPGVRTREHLGRPRLLEFLIRNRDNVPPPPPPPPLPPLFTEAYIRQHIATRQHKSHELGCPTEDELCCICQDRYAVDQEIASLCCGHVYHTECIVGWLPYKNSCPICNEKAL